MARTVGKRKVHNKRLLMDVDRPIPGMDQEAAWLINAEDDASRNIDKTSDAAIKRLSRNELFPLQERNGLG